MKSCAYFEIQVRSRVYATTSIETTFTICHCTRLQQSAEAVKARVPGWSFWVVRNLILKRQVNLKIAIKDDSTHVTSQQMGR